MKIAFTSCMNIEDFGDQPVWRRIEQEKPDYLFLLGDQIYMDFFPHLGEPEGWDDVKFEAKMRKKYENQWAETNFSKLVSDLRNRQGIGGGVYGTWDDHDFAWNNACGLKVPPSKKAIARGLFREFMKSMPNQQQQGIQYSIPITDGNTQIGKAIFLDTRWYRDEPGDNRDLLGEEQFEFLESELAGQFKLTIVCAGTPMRATGKGWLPYQRDYRRFLDLIADRKAIFLSGDIHENAFLPPSNGTNLYEVIASGAAVNKYKFVGKRQNYGILEWSDSNTNIKLADRYGSQSYRIDNATFAYEEHDRVSSSTKD